ncbi:MAG TPA: nucleotidyltransferase domain-containing protein [Clostridiales bacterium]|nr:nucleotidyltransferase domain-containing protein [Clostridiales bacterium]
MMKIDLPHRVIESIKQLGKKYAIQKIILFGSRARGDNSSRSDIDLAIYPSIGFSSKGSFASDIEDLDTLLKIDLVFIDENTDPQLIDTIEKEGVVLYER